MRFNIGESGYLYPTLATAPRVAYSTPTVIVVSVDWPRLTVELNDGRRVETDERNVIHVLPDPSADRRRPRPGSIHVVIPDGSEELTLW